MSLLIMRQNYDYVIKIKNKQKLLYCIARSHALVISISTEKYLMIIQRFYLYLNVCFLHLNDKVYRG